MLLPKYHNFKQERQIGEITIYLPDPPDVSKIANNKLATQDQSFIPIPVPDNFYKWSRADRETWLRSEWDRRNNGYWFFNNGNIEYITGTHYFYVNWWNMPVKKTLNTGRKIKKTDLPSFVDSDRDYFYVWHHCVMDELCAGLIHITNRRDGKSFRAVCTMYEEVSKTPNAIGGIQSKNNTDAKILFKKMVSGWKKLPQFYKPIDVGQTNPSKALTFDEPPRRDTKNQNKFYENVLESEINYRPSKEEAYDGEGLWMYLLDEAGKNVEMNVHSAWNIVKETLVDGTDILGKTLITTTVEEMEKKGGANCKLIWDESDPNQKNLVGMTESGLYRYFKPAFYGLRGDDKEIGRSFVDAYGYSDQDAAKSYLEKRRKGKIGENLMSEMRKYPFTIAEAFKSSSSSNVYNTAKIAEQIEYNESLPPTFLVRGNFAWRNGEIDTEVVWMANPEGRWIVRWMPNQDHRNKIIMKYGKPSPGNEKEIVCGIDPYDHKTFDTTGRKSMAGSHVFLKFDPMNPANTNMFVSEYIFRHPKPETFYEDMIMQAVFYGHSALIESNKNGLIRYFENRGYEHYLMDRPPETHSEWSETKTKKGAKGIPMTGEVPREALMNATETYIHDNVGVNDITGRMGKMFFNRTLDEWSRFDPANWTPFDAAVSSGLALLAARRYVVPKREIKKVEFVRKYNQQGSRSRRIN